MRWLLLLITFLFIFIPRASQAQEQEVVSAEIEVIIWGLPAYFQHNCPIDDRGRIQTYAPQQVTCTMRALDAEGHWTPAVFSVEILGPSGRVEATVADSTLNLNLISRTGIPGVRVIFEARPFVWPRGG